MKSNSHFIYLEIFDPSATAAKAVQLARRGRHLPIDEGEIGDLTRDAVVMGLPLWIASRKGWLYLAANPSWPGLYKIGCTRKSVDRRMAGLGGAGMPTPWYAQRSWATYDAHGLEALCHSACKAWAYRGELFLAPAEVLEASIEATCQADREGIEHALAGLFLPGQASEILSLRDS